MTRWRDRDVVRDLVVSLVASALWLPVPAVLASRIGPPVLLAGSAATVFALSFGALRATAPQRRLRRTVADFCREPSASKTGDLALSALDQLAARGELNPGWLVELTQRRRHPTSRIVDGIDLVVDRHGGTEPSDDRVSLAIVEYLRAVAGAKALTRPRAARQAAQQLDQVLGPRSLLLLYGYSSVVCEAVRAASPAVPIFVVRDAQYGLRGSLGEHVVVRSELASAGLESYLVDSDDITALLDPHTFRLRSAEGAGVPLPDDREVVAVIGCDAADSGGRILIPATVRSQPSETAWFVAEFARARQRSQGQSIGAQLLVVGESYKVFDDLDARSELRTTAAPVPISWWRRFLYSISVADLPRGAPVELVEIGPGHVDLYVDDTVVARTRRGSLRLDASCDAWNHRVGTVQAPAAVTQHALRDLVAGCEVFFVDFNGVLVDDEVDHYCAFAALVRSTTDRSLAIDVYLSACAGRTDAEGIEELRRIGFVTGPLDELVAGKHRHYADHAVPVGDHQRARIESVLDRLREGGTPVLVTASDRASVVAALGDAPFVDAQFPDERALFEVASADRAAAIDAMARSLGMDENRRCLVVDDSARNLAELRRRGYRTLGISGLISDRALPADLVVRDLIELGELLDIDTSRG